MTSPSPQDRTAVDPFAALDTQRTFAVPNPGGRAQPPAPTRAPLETPEPNDDNAIQSGLNPLVALANGLLATIPRIRSTAHLANPAALKETLATGIRDFETQARQKGIAAERIMAARYVLCTLIDESASSTPWGGSGAWGRHSLLALFHNETFGGEKVFQLMAKLAENSAANRDLLELIYAALTLGFEGRYRVLEGGRAQLENVRLRLAEILRRERGDFSRPLAAHWRATNAARTPLLSWLPLAATALVTASALAAAYVAMSFSLGRASDPVFGQIQALRMPPPVQLAAQPAAAPRLTQFLASDIAAGFVAVRDDIDRSVITIRGDGLFDPGSATLSGDRTALMQRIARALGAVPGAVLVTGHTDNQPIRSARYPSNWHLSEARAEEVQAILMSQGVAADRIKAEGLADSQPLAANDSAVNRSMNRRVEVALIVGGPAKKESH